MIISVEITIIAITIAILAGLLSSAVLFTLWVESGRKSWLLWTLATTSLMMELGGIYLGWIAYIRITAGLAGVPVWTSVITTMVVLAMAFVPTWLVIQFVRHSRKNTGESSTAESPYETKIT